MRDDIFLFITFVYHAWNLMYRFLAHRSVACVYRNRSLRLVRRSFLYVCVLFIFVQYLSIKLFQWEDTPAPAMTRLHPGMPVTIDLRSFSVCHPRELNLANITHLYHQRYSDVNAQTCFLVEHLDGGPWLSYVTHEFAEILLHLKQIGIKSNIIYRSLPTETELNYRTDLRRYFLRACDMDENVAVEHQRPIVVLLWDVNLLRWYRLHEQWVKLFQTTRIRITAFIDDLHFASGGERRSRTYLFQSIVSEIFSTYPYLFHNYYYNVSRSKITWLPHAASTLSYRSINTSAENVLFVSGANLIDWYPCRFRGFLVCKYRRDLAACLTHPGYGPTMKNTSAFYYGGTRYFAYMRKYVFGLATCQSVHYAIAKLFEVPANGLAMVTSTDLVPILESLHLYPNEHFLTVDCSSMNQLTEEIQRLQSLDRKKVDKIRRWSQERIHERHLTKHRAALLHVRLLAQALLSSSTSDSERIVFEQWGRKCPRQSS